MPNTSECLFKIRVILFRRTKFMRIKGSILSSCNKLFNCIIYYSNPDNNDYDQAVKDHANKIASSCFSKLGKNGRNLNILAKFVHLIFVQMMYVVSSTSVVVVHLLLNGLCVLMLSLIVTFIYLIYMVKSTDKQRNL